jgi:hypothetical protein
MPNFEVVANGFDGNSDETDDRVFWVSAPSRLHLDYVLKGEPYTSIELLSADISTDMQDFEFILPRDDRELQAKLRAFAKTVTI